VINPTKRPLPDSTQHSQQTHIYARGEIRARNTCKRAAADPRLRLRGHWDSVFKQNMYFNNTDFIIGKIKL